MRCKYLSFAEAPNEIAVTNESGISVCDIGFGGDMETTEKERETNLKI